MEQFRPQSASESTAEGRRASERRPRAPAIWVRIRWLVAFAVIGFWVWVFAEQASMPPMEYSLPFEAWYGNWRDAFIVSAVLLVFVLGLVWPRGRAEWRNAGMYSAFLISLFVEMFGVPLTIFLMAPFLGAPALEFGLNEIGRAHV